MPIREQFQRIIKAAPHLPVQAFTGIVVLFFAIPALVVQMLDEGFIQWTEANGVVADHHGVHERQRDGQPEYFYYIVYDFDVNEKTFNASYERGFPDRASAESDLQTKLSEPGSVVVWYDKSDPSRTSFKKEVFEWPVFLSLFVLLILILAYFRWLMLKYYALELAPE